MTIHQLVISNHQTWTLQQPNLGLLHFEKKEIFSCKKMAPVEYI